MTALATIFALLPMALGITGEGGFIAQPLAVVVIGGLITSTLLTLLLVPTLYAMLELGKERRAKKRAAKRGEAPSQETASDDESEPQLAQR
jgi:HAE1 family hydrophobic/amphiphilic exporter-1